MVSSEFDFGRGEVREARDGAKSWTPRAQARDFVHGPGGGGGGGDDKDKDKVPKGTSATKIVVRNVAFEATKRDIQKLFNPFGTLNRAACEEVWLARFVCRVVHQARGVGGARGARGDAPVRAQAHNRARRGER